MQLWYTAVLGLFRLVLVTACWIPAVVSPVHAATIVLDFEGLQDLEPVESFYNGGLGGFASGPGPDFDITFTSDAITLTETYPTANFTNQPSGLTTLFFLTGSAVMNVVGGFDTGFSFLYSNTDFVGQVTVFDQPNAMGDVLASLTLPALGACTGIDPFCNWAPIGVSFAGIAQSVDFSGTSNEIGFDDITLGSASPGVPVPEPTTLALLGLGAGIVMSQRRLRRSRG